MRPVHNDNGFFVNWHVRQKGEGFEFHLLVLAMTVFLMIRGAESVQAITIGFAVALANWHWFIREHHCS